MPPGKNYKELKKKLLQNPEIRNEYEKLEHGYAIAEMVHRMRIRANLTQAKLAKRIGTKQSNISRIEKGNLNMTIGTLFKIAEATEHRLIFTEQLKTRSD